MKSCLGIPEGYTLTYTLDLQKDKKVFVLLNVLSIVIILPFILGFGLFDFDTLGTFDLFFALPAFMVIITMHEYIHGFFFKRYSHAKVKYQFHGWAFSASTPGYTYKKLNYLIIGLAPAVILNTLLVVLSIVLDGPYDLLAYFVLMLHFSGCIGDFYVTAVLLKYPKHTFVEDTGTGMKFYNQTEPSQSI